MATLNKLMSKAPPLPPRPAPGESGETIRSLLKQPKYADRFQEVLGSRAPQFVSSVIAIASDDKMVCVDPHSIIASCFIGAALDLPIDKNLGFAHIVPYKGYAQFQMGYKGFVQLALRTGQYRFLNTCAVYEGELVEYDKLTGNLTLDPTKKISDTIVGYAAYMELVNGFKHADFWTAEEVKEHSKRYSQAVKSNKTDSPWFTDEEAMGLKTVIKSLISHWGIMSVQMQMAIREDQGIHRTIDTEVEYLDNPDPKRIEAPKFSTGAQDRGLPTTPEPDHPVVKARKLLVEHGQTEVAMLEQMRKGGLDPSLASLDDVYKVAPKWVHDLIAWLETPEQQETKQ